MTNIFTNMNKANKPMADLVFGNKTGGQTLYGENGIMNKTNQTIYGDRNSDSAQPNPTPNDNATSRPNFFSGNAAPTTPQNNSAETGPGTGGKQAEKNNGWLGVGNAGGNRGTVDTKGAGGAGEGGIFGKNTNQQVSALFGGRKEPEVQGIASMQRVIKAGGTLGDVFSNKGHNQNQNSTGNQYQNNTGNQNQNNTGNQGNPQNSVNSTGNQNSGNNQGSAGNSFSGQAGGRNPFPVQNVSNNNPFPVQSGNASNNLFSPQNGNTGNNPFPSQNGNKNPFPTQTGNNSNNLFHSQTGNNSGSNPFPPQSGNTPNNPFPAGGNRNPFPPQGDNKIPFAGQTANSDNQKGGNGDNQKGGQPVVQQQTKQPLIFQQGNPSQNKGTNLFNNNNLNTNNNTNSNNTNNSANPINNNNSNNNNNNNNTGTNGGGNNGKQDSSPQDNIENDFANSNQTVSQFIAECRATFLQSYEDLQKLCDSTLRFLEEREANAIIARNFDRLEPIINQKTEHVLRTLQRIEQQQMDVERDLDTISRHLGEGRFTHQLSEHLMEYEGMREQILRVQERSHQQQDPTNKQLLSIFESLNHIELQIKEMDQVIEIYQNRIDLEDQEEH